MATSLRIFQKQGPRTDINHLTQETQRPGLILQRKSDDSCIARGTSQTADENQRQRPQVYNIPTTILIDPNKTAENKSGLKLWRKFKKIKKKNPFDYRKNICGYITKKVIREFTSGQYSQKAEQLCAKYKCDYNESKNYYSSKIQHVTGPSHIPGLLIPETISELQFKLVFRQFFQWFLREHYLRYLLIEGKMSDKKAYIDYKNNILLNMVNPSNIKYPLRIEHSKKHSICKEEPIVKIEPGIEQNQ